MTLLKPEIVAATAPLQTCAGLPGGNEATIHAVRRMYENPEIEGILLVDASNAFNALNRASAIHNVQYRCPELYKLTRNLYSCEAELFVAGSEETILSREGTTQGGPESNGFYATSTMTLFEPTQGVEGVKKMAFADDGIKGGKLDNICASWHDLLVNGPLMGFYPNASKTWLIVKPEHEERARALFPDINVTSEGRRCLGSFIGNEAATRKYVKDQIEEWKADINDLANIAETEPQLAYSAYVYGTSHRWQFLCRTTPHISEYLAELEDIIKEKLIPALLGGRPISNEMRRIFSLPARHGGLAILNPVEEADFQYYSSVTITSQLAGMPFVLYFLYFLYSYIFLYLSYILKICPIFPIFLLIVYDLFMCSFQSEYEF